MEEILKGCLYEADSERGRAVHTASKQAGMISGPPDPAAGVLFIVPIE
ncbi:MAG: hypothetical protein JWP83_5392 [Mycobacterium sp.]|nr:hypothetical protein [Mycobacterium sp.]